MSCAPSNGTWLAAQIGCRGCSYPNAVCSSVQYLVRVAAERVGLLNVHPHTLRHSCGYYLADKGTDLRTMQDYLGHRDPRHTVHYTRVAGRRFEGLWK